MYHRHAPRDSRRGNKPYMYIADSGMAPAILTPRLLIWVFISRRISSNKADTFYNSLTLDVHKMLDTEHGHWSYTETF